MLLWPDHIRRACLCPRLMVDEYKNNRRRKIYLDPDILPGAFFHDSVAAPIFRAIASGKDRGLIKVVKGFSGDQRALHNELWAHLDRQYLTPAFLGRARPGNLAADHVMAFANGLGILAGFLSETICRQNTRFRSAEDLVKSLFLLPEQGIHKEFKTVGGHTVQIRGKYDALLFDAAKNEFVVLEFKCKTDHELIGDLEQVAVYGWIIRETSGTPTRAALIYLGQESQIKEVSCDDLSQAFQVSARLIDEIAGWLQAPDLSTAQVPPTVLEGVCDVCSLNTRCEALFGPRDPLLGFELRCRTAASPVPGPGSEGVLIGRTRDRDPAPVYWDPFAGNPRLPNGHMLITGTSGSGKTQVLKSLIAGIVEKGMIPIVFDFNNDYTDPEFTERHGLRSHDPCDGLPLNPLELVPDPVSGKVRVAKGLFETSGILKRIYGLGAQQEANLRKAMEDCYRDYGITRDTREAPTRGYPPFELLESKIAAYPNHVPLLNRLSPIFSLNLFSGAGDDKGFARFISVPTVIRLAPLPTEEVKLAVAEFVLLKLYNHLVAGPHRYRPAMAVIVDEAHKVNESNAVVMLFREIRKYGVAMILSSQKARDFHADIHANAGSGLYLKNSEITDRKYIADQLKGTAAQKDEIVDLLGIQTSFEGLFRNDHYQPFVKLRVIPYFERYGAAGERMDAGVPDGG
ncbi:MAG: type IV secretion system DNA-binding domain-containing protein [Pseudomonadota bacterium]